jgi:putative NADH-flavin reductase
VTAFVRSPQKLGPAGDGLAVIRGDPRDADELRAALPGHDAVHRRWDRRESGRRRSSPTARAAP